MNYPPMPYVVAVWTRVTHATDTAHMADRLGIPQSATEAQLETLRDAITIFRAHAVEALQTGLTPTQWVASLGSTPSVTLAQHIEGEAPHFERLCKTGMSRRSSRGLVTSLISELLLALVARYYDPIPYDVALNAGVEEPEGLPFTASASFQVRVTDPVALFASASPGEEFLATFGTADPIELARLEEPQLSQALELAMHQAWPHSTPGVHALHGQTNVAAGWDTAT